jgi:HK97 family phage portal protein
MNYNDMIKNLYKAQKSLSVEVAFNDHLYKVIGLIADSSMNLDLSIKDDEGNVKNNDYVEGVLNDPSEIIIDKNSLIKLLVNTLTLFNRVLCEKIVISGITNLRFYRNFDLEYKNGYITHIKINSEDNSWTIIYDAAAKERYFFINEAINYNSEMGVGLDGRTPYEIIKSKVEMSELVTAWNISQLKNGARFSFFIKSTGIITSNIKEKIKNMVAKVSGGRGSSEPAIFDNIPNSEIEKEKIDNINFQYKELSEAVRDDIAEFFRVPSILVGNTKGSTFNNMEEAERNLYFNRVVPMMEVIAGLLNKVFEKELDGHKIKVDTSFLATLKLTYTDLAALENITFLTANEKRGLVGYKALDGGDDLLFKANLISHNGEPKGEG